MNINVKYIYEEGYLPSKRHKKLRYREVEEEMTITINESTKENAPIAFLVHEYNDNITEYRLWNDKLWKKVLWHERYSGKDGLYPIELFLKSIQYHSSYMYHKDKESAKKEKYDYILKHLIIDNIVYGLTGEPRYVSMTFGLGHNHGGTSLMIDNWYNSNISKNSYFNALERDKAIKFTRERAIKRGDTNDVDRIGESYNIEVLIHEAVKCNPQKEHGNGDPFLNSLYAITESSSSATEAGLLGLCILTKELNRK
jgi:hypothetical protein